jgi:hypothetical protein
MRNSVYYILFILVLISCSSDSNSEAIVVEDFKDSFELFVNGKAVEVDYSNQVYRTENTFTIGGYNNALISFDKSGRFGHATIGFLENSDLSPYLKIFYSFRGFSSKYFNLKIESIDEVNKRIKGSFSGNLFYNPLDIKSEGKFVSGRFYANYRDLVPSVSGLKNTAKINENLWIRTNKYVERSTQNYWDFIQHDLSDDEFKIKIYYNSKNIEKKRYDFSQSDINYKVQLSKFDINTGAFVDYNCSGVLNINLKSNNIIGGTYDFEAVNPENIKEVIKVTKGEFKLVSSLF